MFITFFFPIDTENVSNPFEVIKISKFYWTNVVKMKKSTKPYIFTSVCYYLKFLYMRIREGNGFGGRSYMYV